jgi:predicted DNA-binding transcriptional regulator YafY
VYWSVPLGWFPGAVVFNGAESIELLRHLLRVPESGGRDRLVQRVFAASPARGSARDLAEGVIGPSASENEERWLALVEDARAARSTLRLMYRSSHRDDFKLRYVSVQRVVTAHPARFAGHCHRDHCLKWFRVDNVENAELDRREPFHTVDSEEVTRFIAESLDGFHHAAPAQEHRFVVAEPEARWVVQNLLPGMRPTPHPGGIHVTTTTAAIERLARFVVGLGSAARAESEDLRLEVLRLAEGALRVNGGRGTVGNVEESG